MGCTFKVLHHALGQAPSPGSRPGTMHLVLVTCNTQDTYNVHNKIQITKIHHAAHYTTC
jgi:hypothetical protein